MTTPNPNPNPNPNQVGRIVHDEPSEPSLSETIRQAQSEAIAEAFQVGRVGPAPLVPGEPSPGSADCQSAVSQAGSLPPLSEISNIKSEIPSFSSVSSVRSATSVLIIILAASLLLCASAFSLASFPSRPSVEQSGTSAFSLHSSAFLSELPAPTASALGSWLISAAAALSLFALGKQFMRKTPIEAEFLTKREFQDFKDKDFADLRNRIEHSHESLSNKLDSINSRLSEVGSLVARLDERTKVHNVHPQSTESTRS